MESFEWTKYRGSILSSVSNMIYTYANLFMFILIFIMFIY